MSSNLYPLIYKPGIKRDGTLFQADYCTDGQWVRFQRGNVRKMGGMKAFSHIPAQDLDRVSNILMVPDTNNNDNIIVYLAQATNSITRGGLSQDFETQANTVIVYTIQAGTGPYLWKSELAVQGNNQQVIFIGSVSFNNINNNDNSILLFGNLSGNVNLQQPPILPNLSGVSGALFVNPYLFIYGSNGLVQWSNSTNIQDFSKVADQNISISNDKVIDMKSIRGGVNTPTLLCWTLTSVVRLINTGTAETLLFQKDVLSKSSSILSSRCVVEYDGLFFWPGTNRFFQYNGIVQELSNTMNLNYFYYNLDMSNRQLVYGVKNTQFGEIWWFYPKKGQNAINGIFNNRAIIYNIRENAWYDTEINRSAAYYSEDYGFMATYGQSLTTPVTPLALYRHEYETFGDQNLINLNINEQIPIANERVVEVPIPSNITTPTISWAAFNPMKQLTGVDRWMYLITIEPDFTLMPPPNPQGLNFFGTDMTVVINTKQYAQDLNFPSPAYQIISPLITGMDPLLAKVDTAYQGRHITLTFTTTKNFEMGHIMLLIGIGDGQ